MLLQDKVAVIYGAGGAVGGAVARAMAQQGARVFLTGRRRETVELAAQAIREAGGVALAAQVDALDEGSVERHVEDVVQRAGTIDVSFNAIGLPQEGIQGIPLTELTRDQKDHVRKVMADVLAPFRKEDADEAMKLVEANGFDHLHMAFDKNHDIGNDGVWDVWQIEGPAMLWYFRGEPHVHTWVHVRKKA